MAKWHVYLLRCGDDSLYAGVTTDLGRRLREHAAGTGAKYTRARLPVRLAWSVRVPSRSAALKREAAIRRLSRKEKLTLVGLKKKRK
jgi:putative endonuclease